MLICDYPYPKQQFHNCSFVVCPKQKSHEKFSLICKAFGRNENSHSTSVSIGFVCLAEMRILIAHQFKRSYRFCLFVRNDNSHSTSVSIGFVCLAEMRILIALQFKRSDWFCFFGRNKNSHSTSILIGFVCLAEMRILIAH